MLRLQSGDGTNRLTRACVLALTECVRELACTPEPWIITGNRRFFSAGADLGEMQLCLDLTPTNSRRWGKD